MSKQSSKQIPALDGRLSAAASFVRDGAVFADIGTDHAYLPIALYRAGRICRGIAADVAEEPLHRAEAHICASGLSGCIETVLTDGLSGLEDRAPTDIAVCGMGGELIARILSDAPYVRNAEIRLILQPMTMQPYLRRFLCREGFSILDEVLASAAGKLYPVLSCTYTGTVTELTPAEALLGPCILKKRAQLPLFRPYLAEQIARCTVIVNGKQKAHADASAEAALLSDLRRLAEETDGKA